MTRYLSGEKNPMWRGGFPSCKDCGKKLSRTKPQPGREGQYHGRCKACAGMARINKDPRHMMNVGIGNTIKMRFRNCLRDGTKTKYEKYLGCSFLELKEHLEFQFWPHMTWDNFGHKGWHIDHIKPISSFDLNNEEERYKAFHYTNLQPLWWFVNLSKGSKYGVHDHKLKTTLKCGHAGELLYFMVETEGVPIKLYKTKSYAS